MNIALIEPQCTGLQHVPFNASLLESIALAIPEASLVFSGESTHVERVREALGKGFSQKLILRSGFGGIVRNESAADLPRLWFEAWRVCRYCRSEKVDVLIICSASPAFLAAISAMRPRSTAVIVVLHACLAGLLFNPLTQCLRNPLSIHAVARLPVPRGVRVVVLGSPILASLKTMGLGSARWESIDHPYSGTGEDFFLPPSPPVCFGYLAGFERGDSGTREMLDRVKRKTGCMVNWIGRDSPSSEALTPEEYRRRLRESHYAVWLGDARSARLRASATFLDALSMGKPLIYLKNDFMDYYHAKRGAFGFPVSDVEEMEKVLLRLGGTPIDDNYRRLAETALAVSRSFSPAAVSPNLRAIILAAREEVKKP